MKGVKNFSAADELFIEKRRLLEQWLEEEGIKPSPTITSSRRKDFAELPLSFAQQRLWFIDQLEQGSPFYNIPSAVRLQGPLNLQALCESFDEIIRRHEALRTSFREVDGQPTQVIAPELSLNLSTSDLGGLTPTERETKARQLASEEARRPFDLQRGPLLRVKLMRLSEDEHILLVVMHHIVSDGWSVGVLLRELATLYQAFSAGQTSMLANPSIQYADYTLWQREWLQGEVLESQLAYWKRQLDGLVPMLELPTDRIRPKVQTFRGAQVFGQLSKSLSDKLLALSRHEDVTLFMTLLAAFNVLLSRHTGQEDIAVGSPIANRVRPETEDLIGFFANTLVLRTDLSGEPSFRRLLSRVHAVALEAYAHQDIPFEKLVEELQPARNMSRHPLFQVAFTLQNTPLPALEIGDLKLSTVDMDTGTAKFDLTLIVEETECGLTTSLEYDTGLFEEQTVARMLDHFQTLLEGIVADPGRRISELPLVGATERDQLLHKWNDGRSAYQQDACVHQLFETQAERTPDAIALVLEDEQLSYKELNRRANQLAHHLRKRGVGPERLVAIMAEPSTEMIVGLLGILKAGGAYLPLDPTYPRERLAFMLTDARSPVLLTQQELIERLPAEHGAQMIRLDADWETIAQESGKNPVTTVMPENPAYVIYTSGSTGQPKGVLVCHTNVVRLFQATQNWFQFDESDVWSLFHSYAFDFSVWELWGALLYGGRLVIVPYWVSRSPDAFLDLLVREQVTVLNQTPSAFRQLMQVDESADVGKRLALRLVVFGGEALELQSLRPWFDRHGDERPQLVNMYGITETTVHVTYRSLSKADLEKTSGSHIGGPIPDLCVYILDRHLEPVPLGVAGEMYLSGAGLARGYLRRPELTAERFVPHPFSREAGARLYRTGDRARRLPCGDIEYLGRIDQQVKIRGFRIEPGEVEAALDKHPAIRESVVLARQDTLDEKRLVAYIVPRHDQSPTVSELRQVMKEKLPDYMVPAAFVFLDKLPLTPQGKIDRRALPSPDRERPERERVYAAPSNWIEETLAEIWSEVLGMEQVGVDDNYFALGGDSIRSIQVRAKAQKRGLLFSLQQLFRHQTIRELAQALSVADDDGASTHQRQPFSVISTEDRRKLPREVEDAYPLSHLQAGLVFHSEYSPDYAIYITSFYLRLPLDVQKLEAAVEQIVSRHEMLRTSFDLNGFSEPLQLVHRSVEIPLHIEDLRHIASKQQQAWLYDWMETELHRKFDWNCAPLLRLSVHRRSDESFQFTLSEPFFDGWSVASLVTELFERYLALLKGSPLAIKPLSATYSDFVALEREALLSTETQHYWRQKLSEATASKLPRHPSSQRAERPPKVSRVIVPISPEVSDGVQRLARSIGVSLKSVLLAAHLKVVGLMSGQADVFTGLFVNGRPERTDGERVLGIFLNILPLRFKLQGGAWADLARRAFEAERELLPFRRYPIQELQRIHGAENLFDTAFNFTHFHVYQRLQNMAGVESLMHEGNEQTYYALTAQFNLDETSSRVHLALDYRELELCPEQVETIAGYYTRVLAAIVNDPQARHESLCLLSEREQRLLAAWNETHVDYPNDGCFHQLFEMQVEETPDVVALVFDREQLTYGELNKRANQLGNYLRTLGVGPEVLVGICTERSVEMIVGLLGVLKAGGAYVPLDPQYPRERLKFTLEDAEVKVLLTQRHLTGILPEQIGHVVCLDTEWMTIAQEGTGNVASDASGANLAYVMYTSGSTGRPKGAGIEHHSTRGLMHWARSLFGPEQTAGVLAATSICFDMSVFEIFVPLCWGGAVILAENALQLPTLPATAQVTLLSTVPSAMAELVRIGGVPDTVRVVTLAGEVLQQKLVQQVYQRTKIEEAWNLYGLSEDTSYTTAALIKRGDGEMPTIGRPIANRQVYVLDEQLQPVPLGVTGELYTSGEGLARCYVKRPHLTAERFIPNPFSHAPGARMYRTGDLARYREDGSIECLGRIDQQVKIRGFRIELGEVEAALLAHGDVKECAVLVREDVPGEKHLVAYLVPQQDREPTDGELRSYLKSRLPKFMVPSIFVLLDEMPLTANGKVNRRAFPAPEASAISEGNFVAPRTPVEELLANLWAQVFSVEQVGVFDNFFDLGGHSLLAMRLISRVRDAFQVELSVRSLFESPTIAGLAEGIEKMLSAGQSREAPPILPVPRSKQLPLSFAQQRLWFIDQLEQGSPFYNIPSAVRLQGPLNLQALRESFDEIIRRHEALRTSFREVDGQPAQVIAAHLRLDLPILDFSGLPEAVREAEVQRLAREEVQRPFDLSQCPLLRAQLIRLSETEHALIVVMHHIISDGWSLGIFMQEMAELYSAFASGQASPLAELPIQYVDFAQWQREWLRGETLQTQLDHWKRQLAGAPALLELPTDRPRPKVQTFRGAKYPLTLSAKLSEETKALSCREGATLFMTLFAVYLALLHHYTKQTDMVVGTAIANRNRAEIENLIGFFVNTLALRTNLSGDPGFSELLSHVREVALAAYAHQDLPFEKLVEELQPARDPKYPPLVQVMFVSENAPMSDPELSGLSLSPISIDGGGSKFDLALLVLETTEGLTCLFEYNTDLFEAATISRMATHYETLLRSVIAQPETRLSMLGEVLDEAERRRHIAQEKEYEEIIQRKLKRIMRRAAT